MHDIRRIHVVHEILSALNISPKLFPDIYYSTQITGKISKKAAGETGLMEGDPVVAGSGDSARRISPRGRSSPGTA
jgi:xylulokinase